jgi:hypothetical protein
MAFVRIIDPSGVLPTIRCGQLRRTSADALPASLVTSRRETASAPLPARRRGRLAQPGPPPGPDPRLSAAQLATVEQALLQGAQAHGFDTNLWTLERVAVVITKLTEIR